MALSCTLPSSQTMGPDHAIYVYGNYYNSLHEILLNEQPSYTPQPNLGGETFIVAGEDRTCVEAAGLLQLDKSRDGHNFYQTTIGGSSAAPTSQYPGNTMMFPYSDTSDAPETLSETSFHLPQTGPIDYPGTSIVRFLDPITSETIQPSYSIFTSNGVQHYRCVCGHEARRKGDMRRHHESSKHSCRKHFCSLCERWFTRQDGLRRHRQKKHPAHQSLPVVIEFTAPECRK